MCFVYVFICLWPWQRVFESLAYGSGEVDECSHHCVGDERQKKYFTPCAWQPEHLS